MKKLDEIMPQANLVVYMQNYTMVTVDSSELGTIAIIISHRTGNVDKFIWKNISIIDFVRYFLPGNAIINTIVSYNDENYIIYDKEKFVVEVTKKEIAEKFNTTVDYLKIVS